MRVDAAGKIPIKMWLETIEDGAMAQARDLANLPFAFRHIAIMPDSHVGYGMPIGGVMATTGVVVPNAVGVDIGCGMAFARTTIKDIDTETLKIIMGKVRESIPVGFNHHKDRQEWQGFNCAPDIGIIQEELQSASHQMGTLGGGNHFIEIQRDDSGTMCVMVHSGSRNFGFKTAKYYHEKAKELCALWYSDIPNKDLSFLPMDAQEGKEYIHAMNYCLSFAHSNREAMMDRVLAVLKETTGASWVDFPINVHHNYAAMENHFGHNVMVHRKGAIRAREGQVGIIPGSMGTASYITEGLGNPESFMSSSHGAGRRMGRADATRRLNLGEERAKMGTIVHGLRNQADLDEAPGAYKDIEDVMANQADLVKITSKLTPLASIKG